jgi:hypothetical protein
MTIIVVKVAVTILTKVMKYAIIVIIMFAMVR